MIWCPCGDSLAVGGSGWRINRAPKTIPSWSNRHRSWSPRAPGSESSECSPDGGSARAWRVPCTLDTRFDTASVTKLFTAVAAPQLVERAAFALDTSVIEYLGLDGTTISMAVTP